MEGNELSQSEAFLIRIFRRLNQEEQDKQLKTMFIKFFAEFTPKEQELLIEYAEELVVSGEYKKADSQRQERG